MLDCKMNQYVRLKLPSNVNLNKDVNLICILEPEQFPETGIELIQSIGQLLPPEKHKKSHILFCRLSQNIDAKFIAACPDLKCIVTPTTGLDHINLEAARLRGIKVLSLREERQFTDRISSTAEMTWALILAIVRKIPAAVRSVTGGKWDRMNYRGNDLQGKSIGLIGVGRIGCKVAKYAEVFGMKVLGYDPNVSTHPGVDLVDNVRDLLRRSDIVSVHVNLNSTTNRMIGAEEFSMMKNGSYFVNTSRGEVLDEAALISALEKGQLKGAALDVIQNERGEIMDSPVVRYAGKTDNIIITPHIGGATFESMEAVEIHMAKRLMENIANENI